MPSISMNNENLSKEMEKEGTGSSRTHPKGKHIFRCVAIEYCEIKTVLKSTANPFFFFHWRSKEGILTDFCTLSPKATFQFANRTKALNAKISNPQKINYAGLIGRICEIEVEHEELSKSDGTKFTVANPKYFNVYKGKTIQPPVDLSDPKFEHMPTIYKDYTIEAPEGFNSNDSWDNPNGTAPNNDIQDNQNQNQYAPPPNNAPEEIAEDDLPF